MQMQDIHSIGSGGGGRFFGGGGGDRRFRPHHGPINPPVMKCPRCDSSNTKFCYYNNYNLSQPRHFCKSCRRYWTKGGVLRNVPVGGGCRKAKRSKPKGNSSEPSDAHPKENNSSNSQNSCSESSSLTASTTAATVQTTATNGTTATEVLSGSSSNSASTFLNFQESRFFSIPHSKAANPNFDPPLIDQSSETGMFPEIGIFSSLMTSSNDPIPLSFNITGVSPYRSQQQSHGQVAENQSSDQYWQQQQKQEKMIGNMQELGGGYLDQTVQMEFLELQNRANDGGLAAVDWQSGGGDQGLFDLAGTVDQSYWNQTQWADDVHQLNYLP